MKSRQPHIVVRRYPASYLSDIVYGIQPMPVELAEVIRMLRRDYDVTYPGLGDYLCETDLDSGASLGIGKALTQIASTKLDDKDRAWI